MASDLKDLGQGMQQSVSNAVAGRQTIGDKIDVLSGTSPNSRAADRAALEGKTPTPTSGSVTYPEVRNAIAPTIKASDAFVIPLQGITHW
jgi:hypothetical protein